MSFQSVHITTRGTTLSKNPNDQNFKPYFLHYKGGTSYFKLYFAHKASDDI